MHKLYHKNKIKPHQPQFSTYTFLLRTNSQIVAHFQEMGYKVLVEKDVDRDLAVVVGILKVTEDLNVCEGIHHKGNHLQGKPHHLLKRLILHKTTASPSHFLLLLSSGTHAFPCPAALALASSKRFLYSHNTPVNSLCPSTQSIGLKRFFLCLLLLYTFTSSFPTQSPVVWPDWGSCHSRIWAPDKSSPYLFSPCLKQLQEN